MQGKKIAIIYIYIYIYIYIVFDRKKTQEELNCKKKNQIQKSPSMKK